MAGIPRAEWGNQAQWAVDGAAPCGPSGGRPILRLPLCGTTAQLLFGYCPMARMLQLMPWNRPTLPTWRDVVEVTLRPPGDEGLLSFLRAHSGVQQVDG
jgi:hypothetical protein